MMKHATLFYRLLVVYVFAFLATIIFPFDGAWDVTTAQAPAKVRVASPQDAVLEEAVLVKASVATPALSDRVSPAQSVTMSH